MLILFKEIGTIYEVQHKNQHPDVAEIKKRAHDLFLEGDIPKVDGK